MNEYGGNFDQVFGAKTTMQSLDGTMQHFDSRTNSFGGVDITESGRVIANTKEGYTNGHDTFVNGKHVSSTQTDIFGNTKITNAVGEELGTIKTSIFSDGNELYVDEHLVARSEVDVSGNQKILNLEDPLTKAHEYALVELVLSR